MAAVKNYSKRSKRKHKRSQRVEQDRPQLKETASRPTPERRKRGVWTEPKGMGKNDIPAVDLTADMIGMLLHRKIITSSQEQAARTFQAARLAYIAELPEVSGYKSCIAGDVPGFDGGNGDPAVIERYRDIERAVGRAGRSELLWVCEDQQKPRSVELLRWALGVIGEM